LDEAGLKMWVEASCLKAVVPIDFENIAIPIAVNRGDWRASCIQTADCHPLQDYRN
jgi:hypothetical protein